jgi:hypothetical protein
MPTVPTREQLQTLTFSDSGIDTLGFTTDKRRYYNEAWNFYVYVILLQRDIAVIRLTDPKRAFYRFDSYDERASFLLGRRLHQEAHPEYDWCEEYP